MAFFIVDVLKTKKRERKFEGVIFVENKKLEAQRKGFLQKANVI